MGRRDPERATAKVVPRSYVTNLRKGRIENPGYEKMPAIAKGMGVPPALWFDETPGDEALVSPEQGQDLASRVGHLFDVIPAPPGDGRALH